MEVPNSGDRTQQQRPTVAVKLGRFTLAGPWAIVVLLATLLLIVALIAYSRPAVRMLLSAAIWIVLFIYWNIPSKNTAPPRSAEALESRQRHQNLLIAAILLLFIPVPGLSRQFLPQTPLMIRAGLGVQAGSALLYFWARRHLGRFWSGAVTVVKDHQLVGSGPYRLVRHPMYSAMLGVFAGTTVVSGQYHALVGLVIAGLAYWRKIRIEERALGEAFGPTYETYRGNTWALIPWLF